MLSVIAPDETPKACTIVSIRDGARRGRRVCDGPGLPTRSRLLRFLLQVGHGRILGAPARPGPGLLRPRSLLRVGHEKGDDSDVIGDDDVFFEMR